MKKVEMWKDIEGYEGRYQVSNLGSVKSLITKERILKPGTNNRGYLYVALSENGEAKNFLVHRLVALHFIPNPGQREFVNHIDGDKTNNMKSNLEWNTFRENYNHAMKNNLLRCNVRSERTFTNEEVRTIRRLNKKDKKEFSGRKLALYLNSDPSIISRILNFRTYRNVN